MKMQAVTRSNALIGILLFGAIALCTSCATSASGSDSMRSVSAGQAFTMRPGDDVVLPDRSALHYQSVTTDSRCPPDVRCIWAGDAEVAFKRRADGAAPEMFSLHTGQGARDRDFESGNLTLVSLARGTNPQAELRWDPIAGR